MKKINILFSGLILLGLMLSGYQCSSAEMSSAKLYIQQKNWDKAIESLKKEINKNPKSDEGFFLLGRTYAGLDNPKIDSMLYYFDESLKISDKYNKEIEAISLDMWVKSFNMGVQLFQKYNENKNDSTKVLLENAVKSLETAIQIEPDSIKNYQLLQMILLSSQNYEKSESILLKLENTKYDEFSKEELGKTYIAAGSTFKYSYIKNKGSNDPYLSAKALNDSAKYIAAFDKAINHLKKAFEKYPSNSNIFEYLAGSLVEIGKTDEAIALYDAKLKTDLTKTDPEIVAKYHTEYGVFLSNTKKYEDALAQFTKSLEIDAKNIVAYYYLGFNYYNWGIVTSNLSEKGKDDPTAKEYWGKAIENAMKYLALVSKTELSGEYNIKYGDIFLRKTNDNYVIRCLELIKNVNVRFGNSKEVTAIDEVLKLLK